MSAAEPLPCEDRYPNEPGETCTREGAFRNAIAIEEFWAAQGKVVNTRIVNMGFSHATRGARYEVRTDMRNGMPRPDAVKLTNGPVEVKFEREDTY